MQHKYDKIKNKSSIFEVTKQYALELLKNPEVVERAISDRNIIIKSLKSSIDHRKIAFKEIEDRYEHMADTNKSLNDKVLELKQLETVNVEKIQKLQNELNIKIQELETLKIAVEVNKQLKENSLLGKFEKLGEHGPWFTKILFKFLSSEWVFYTLIASLFLILFIASFTGWAIFANAISPIIKLFL